MSCRSSPKRLFVAVIGSPPSFDLLPVSGADRHRASGASQATALSQTDEPVKVRAIFCLLARLYGELDKDGADCLRGQHRRRKFDPGDAATAAQVEPLRVDPGHPPTLFLAAEQFLRIKLYGVGMILVHMAQDRRFG